MLRSALLVLLAVPPARSAGTAHVLAGIDVLEGEGFEPLRGMRVGLTTNQAGRDRLGRSTLQVLAAAPAVTLAAVFAPEHGLEGTLEDADVSSSTIRLPGGRVIPLYPSFGAAAPPAESAFKGLDALVFDLPDVGVRFFTYATTLAMAMERAARLHIPVYVLDRPDPITGDIVEGPLLDPDARSFVSYFRIPVRHGMTIGEVARFYNTTEKVGADLRVVKVRGWKRKQWYDETGLPWTRPSPNMPDLESAALYPGIGCLEATNLSVGRGTPRPFRWVGAPWLKPERALALLRKARLPGVEFEAASFTPYKDVYAGKECPGISIRLTDRAKARPLDIFVYLACALRDSQGGRFDLRWDGVGGRGAGSAHFFMPTSHRLIGSARFRQMFDAHASPAAIVRSFRGQADAFKASRAPFLLY